MRHLIRSAALAVAAGALLFAGGVVARTQMTTTPFDVRAGTYVLDSEHGKITWSVDHLGLSTYYGQFVNVAAELTLDPANPANSRLTATVPLTDVDSNSDGLDSHLQTADFFDAANHPTATFVATSIVVDQEDPTEAEVNGELTLRGVTRPVTLDVEFNAAGMFRGRYKVGFDGEATIRRSEFGISYALPAVGDEVELHIEGEFVLQPAG